MNICIDGKLDHSLNFTSVLLLHDLAPSNSNER